MGKSRPGHWDGREDSCLRGARKGSAVAKKDDAYVVLYGRLRELRAVWQTLQQIADALNSDGHTTRLGKPWNPT